MYHEKLATHTSNFGRTIEMTFTIMPPFVRTTKNSSFEEDSDQLFLCFPLAKEIWSFVLSWSWFVSNPLGQVFGELEMQYSLMVQFRIQVIIQAINLRSGTNQVTRWVYHRVGSNVIVIRRRETPEKLFRICCLCGDQISPNQLSIDCRRAAVKSASSTALNQSFDHFTVESNSNLVVKAI